MDKPTLAQKLVEVMKSVDRVPKNGRNDYHGYDYALEADIMDAVRGKLGELGILVTTSIEQTTKTGAITEIHTLHTFIDAETKETLAVKGYGQGQDSGDKGGYKAITGSVKYFLTKNFLIPTGDDPEQEAAPPKKVAPKRATMPVATEDQLKQIKTLAARAKLDIRSDIYAKMGIQDQPTKPQAEKILTRLRELTNGRQTASNGQS